MAELTVQTTSLTGLNPAYVAASAGGDTFANDSRTVLSVKNGGVGAITVTVDSVTACNHGFDHDAAVSVPAAGERTIGPFEAGRFGFTTSVTYSGVTSVTVAAIKV